MKRFDFESIINGLTPLNGGLDNLINEAAKQSRFKGDLLFTWASAMTDAKPRPCYGLFAYGDEYVHGESSVLTVMRSLSHVPLSMSCRGTYHCVFVVREDRNWNIDVFDVTCCAPEFLDTEE